MKKYKRSIKYLVCLIALSACSRFDNELMVCESSISKEYSQYEIEYHGNSIKNVEVVTNIDYSNVGEEAFKSFEETFKEQVKRINRKKGLHAELQVDLRMLTYLVEVDISKYDVEEDSENVFEQEFRKENFKDIHTVREAIVAQSFVCDEIVER